MALKKAGTILWLNAKNPLTSAVDYEAELAVIIGKAWCNITQESAMEHVWGYTIINDVTARDRQRNHKQWFAGKALDTFCPMATHDSEAYKAALEAPGDGAVRDVRLVEGV